jgi:coenzyme F420 hydrogenase subunit beta
MDTISQVVSDGLCCGCGTCVSLCPTGAIILNLDKKKGVYIPYVQINECKKCGICYRVCPGHGVDFKQLNEGTFGSEPDDILIGNYQECFLGYAKDNNVRYNASSGGVVTSLLLFALDTGLIDGALVTRMKNGSPFEPEPFIARSREEIISASKSKYCPVPVNIILKEILQSEPEMKYAIVGLPCQIQGIRKAMLINEKLREKIAFQIGLFCSHSDNFHQNDQILSELGVDKGDVSKINYRGEGWPGQMSVELKNSQVVFFPYFKGILYHTMWFNVIERCLFCCDLTAELADISCGDPWLDEVLSNEKMGKSILIARSDVGTSLYSNAKKAGYIEADTLDPSKVHIAGDMMVSKKKDIFGRFFIRKLFGKSIPSYNTELVQPNFKNYARGIAIYVNAWVSSKSAFRKLIRPMLHAELKLVSILGIDKV